MAGLSTHSAPAPAVNWQSLIRAVKDGECILVLGPGVATLERDGERLSLTTLLARHLAEKLRQLQPGAPLLDGDNLPYVAKALEDAIFLKEVASNRNYSPENARAALAETIQDFYGQFTFQDFPVYRQLARMPFHFVVETNPAPFLAQAYDQENKFDARCLYYHYANPSHNNRIQIPEGDIREDSPLVYHLFGAAEEPGSMVVTERDQLAFLDAILQKENTAGIPSSVAIHFTSARERQFDKTFVFLGFDFNQWHLRLIMHLIARYQRQRETYALQDSQSLDELTAFFYRNNFDVRFEDKPADLFLEEFKRELQKPAAVAPAEAPQIKVFLMYSPEDQEAREALDKQLAPLKKTDFIQTWDEAQILPGAESETEINRHLEAADIILLLVTADFFNSGTIYEKYLQTALQRHEARQTVVIPLLMRSCVWEETPLGQLTTILPRNKTTLDKQENPEAALSDTVGQLQGWCQKIVGRKKLAR
ncbi:MAG: toll/interleukin-1 receptor domain-containing protein [Lewinellaceae bacterium]|nr:toll/interleukin-1 receptor domain-containing protein [Phaeodactylibacter sp.]MCB9041813.1 toll/interleukin-1 receptor domain-containing protein [Lewinellaceae bacterium]